MKYKEFSFAVVAGTAALVACATDSGFDDLNVERADAGEDALAANDGGGDAAATGDARADSDAQRPLVCGDAGYCETQLPLSDLGEPLSLSGIWAVSPNDVWSVALEGYVLHWDGTSWRIDYKIGHALHTVWATKNSVWIGGDLGTLLRRSSDGTWNVVESGHTATIRSIGGTDDDDVWFTSRDGTVDHFDGTAVTNHSLGAPVVLTTVFGDAAGGMYAAGYVGLGIVAHPALDRPYAYRLSAAGATPFNTAFPEQQGFVPTAGAVVSTSEEEPRLLLAGYRLEEYVKLEIYPTVSVSHYEKLEPGVGLVITDTPSFPRPPLSLYARNRGDVYMAYSIFDIIHWDGSAPSKSSLDMGQSYLPRPIAGIHGSGGDIWIIGDGFALKGSAL